jgi:hypothetical protein
MQSINSQDMSVPRLREIPTRCMQIHSLTSLHSFCVFLPLSQGLYLGTSGYALNFSANFDSSHNSTWRAADTVFKCAPGFDGQTWGNTTLAGSPTFLVDEMEVYALAAKINHTSDHAHATSTSTPARAVYNRGKGGKRLGPSPVAQRVMKTAPSRYAEEFSDYSD